jgi:hypothetical protein
MALPPVETPQVSTRGAALTLHGALWTTPSEEGALAGTRSHSDVEAGILRQGGSVHMTQDTCGKQVLPTSPSTCT